LKPKFSFEISSSNIFTFNNFKECTAKVKQNTKQVV